MDMDEFPMFEATADDGPGCSAGTNPSTVYEALPRDCFRLLRILPGDLTSEVCCEIGQYAFSSQVEYTALSYVWGAESAEHSIRLNGKKVNIRENLWRFLCQQRTLVYSLGSLIWIDALCINQSDEIERTAQVNLMPHIYSNANQVLVWLGPSYAGSDRAFEHIARPVSSWRAKGNILRLWNDLSAAAICGICERPYWTRLWVFQELLLARQVKLMCGSKTVSLERFQNLLNELRNSVLFHQIGDRFEHKFVVASPATSLMDHRTRQLGQHSLVELMRATQHLRCAELSDKVYALLGVAAAGDVKIDPDYTMPLPALLNAVLKNQHSFTPPKSISEVETLCEELASLLEVPVTSMFEITDQRSHSRTAQDSYMFSCRPGTKGSLVTLWWAAFYGHNAIQDLISEVNLVDPDFVLAAGEGNIAALLLMLDTGKIDVNGKDKSGRTALHAATIKQEEAVVRMLLELSSINVDCAEDETEMTALHYAAQSGDYTVAKLLVNQSKANVNLQDQMSSSSLYLAASAGHREIVQLLLDNGADVKLGSYRDGFDWLPLHGAVFKGHESIVRLLIATGKVDLNSTTPHGATALQLASIQGNTSVVKLLLSVGDTNVDTVDNSGCTALHKAATIGAESIVQMLLDVGEANANLLNEVREKALTLAVKYGHVTTAKRLYDVTEVNIEWATIEADMREAVKRKASRRNISHPNGDYWARPRLPGLRWPTPITS